MTHHVDDPPGSGVTFPRAPLTLSARVEQMFPRLTPAQIARVEARGRVRQVGGGEVLVDGGGEAVPFFVVKSGRLEIARPGAGAEPLVALHEPGEFTGEVNMLSGRPSLVRIRATEPGEVIELGRDRLLGLVQTDSELSEIFMRAFILRRVELIAQGTGDVVVLGSSHCAGTLRVKEFLTRNAHPYKYVDLDREADVQSLLDSFQVDEHDVPVVIYRGETLRHPTNEQIADCLGYNAGIDTSKPRDVVVLGAGPAGLAAAVYAASEGLDVLVLEPNFPGGQAGSSSKIENYLGFPTGISGQALAGRAYTQAQKFGAQVMVARGARKLDCAQRPYAIEMGEGLPVQARALVIATGAQYRKLPLENLARFEGTGAYYAASFMEAQLCVGEEVIVVGGGNSAGQAAVFLAQTAARVHMLVRSSGLADTMSRYLIRRIEESPKITLRPHTEVVEVGGEDHLERVRWRNRRSGEDEEHPIRHVFVMTGAIPCTQWLDGCLAVDDKGFVKTGQDLSVEDLAEARWPLARSPYVLETSLPGVFAVGDVRSGNVKRVASAVGEGSIAISFVHRVLAE